MAVVGVAFVIGEFDFVEGKDKNGVLVRVYTPVGRSQIRDKRKYTFYGPISVDQVTVLGY